MKGFVVAKWTVGELIDELSDYDPEWDVVILDDVSKKEYGMAVDDDNVEKKISLIVSEL